MAIGAGLYIGWRGVSGKFRKRLKSLEMGRAERRWVRGVGTVGMVARMLIAMHHRGLPDRRRPPARPRQAVGIDGALKRLADRSYGPDAAGPGGLRAGRLRRVLLRRGPLPPSRRALRRAAAPTGADGASCCSGRAADGRALWLAVAAVLGVSGGRFRRRAALRGLFAAGTGVGGGQRAGQAGRPPPAPARGRLAEPPPRLPEAADVVVPVRPRRRRRSPSPSGAGQEVPALAGPLVGLAAPGRVLAGPQPAPTTPPTWPAGAALGAGAGLAHPPAVAGGAPRAGARAHRAQAGRRRAVARGRGAGRRGQPLGRLQRAGRRGAASRAARGRGRRARRRATTSRRRCEDAADRGCAIGVAGGDGSINAAAAIAAETGKPLFVVPGGTLNHFAYALGLESIADAARAVRDGRAVSVDRAVIDGHTFVNTASIGSYVDLVDAREKLEDRIGKWPAVVVALVRVLRHPSRSSSSSTASAGGVDDLHRQLPLPARRVSPPAGGSASTTASSTSASSTAPGPGRGPACCCRCSPAAWPAAAPTSSATCAA